MPEQQPLRALQAVFAHILGKRQVALIHLARDRLRPDVLLPDPRMRRRESVERLVEKLALRLRVLDLLQFRHALIVADARRLQLVDFFALQLVHLPAEDLVGVLDNGLAQRQHLERIIRRRPVEQRQRVDQVERECLMQREVVLQLHVHLQLATRREWRNPLDNFPVQQRAKQLPRAAAQRLLLGWRLVAVGDQLLQHPAAVRLAAEHQQQQAGRNIEARHQSLGRRGLEAGESLLVPTDLALGRALLHELLLFFRIARRLLLGALVLDAVRRCLGDHIAPVVKTLSPGAARDLAEIAHAEHRRLLPVVFPELREHHRADRHVDADAERVRAADELEPALLRELLDEDAVFRQQPRVVHADAVPQPALHLLAVRTGETHALQLLLQCRLLLLRADAEAHQTLRGLRRRALREMHEVDRRTLLLQQRGHALGQGRLGILELQRHRPAVAAHRHARCAGEPRHVFLEKLRRPERRRHQQKSCARHREQRHLPRVTALGVGVVVKLVHDHRADVALRPAVQRDVRQNFRRAAQHARLRVHARVARHHADVLRPEVAAQREEFLVHQRLDRTGVDRALPRAQRLEMKRRRDERFARARRRVEHDVVSGEQLEDRLLLLGIELQPPLRHHREKPIHHPIRVGRSRYRRQWRRRGRGGIHPPTKHAPAP